MTWLFVLLAVVAAIGTFAAWIGGNPGTVTMFWFDYQIETSVAVLLLLVSVIVLLVLACYHVIRDFVAVPLRYSTRRDLKHYRRGLSEITHSVAALAASNVESAKKHTRKAEKALGVTPLTLLLRAQISKSAGNDEEARGLLEQLLEHPETEYLAAKSLSDVAQKQQHLPQALTLAQRAQRVSPKDAASAWSVFNLHLGAGQLTEAEADARTALKNGAFSRADFNTASGRIAYRQAESSYAAGHKENALLLAQKAFKLLPGDLKAAELYARLCNETNRPAEALKAIRAQWKGEPSATLAEEFHHATDHFKIAKKDRLAAKLQATNGGAAENVLLEK